MLDGLVTGKALSSSTMTPIKWCDTIFDQLSNNNPAFKFFHTGRQLSVLSRASLVSGPGAKISAQKWPPPDTNLWSLVFVELCGANLRHCGSEVGLSLGWGMSTGATQGWCPAGWNGHLSKKSHGKLATLHLSCRWDLSNRFSQFWWEIGGLGVPNSPYPNLYS